VARVVYKPDIGYQRRQAIQGSHLGKTKGTEYPKQKWQIKKIYASFFAAFTQLRKTTINYVMPASVSPSVRMKQLCSHWTDFNEI
jgi:hypothetical protein